MNGRVVAVHAKAGDTAEAGRALVVLEAMKMEHALSVPAAARVKAVHVAAGRAGVARPASGRTGASTMTQAHEKIEARLRHVFEQLVPFNRVLGIKVESIDPAAPKLRFDMRPDLIGNPRRQMLHGGVISAVLDVTAGIAIHLAVAQQKSDSTPEGQFPNIGTINLHVDYLRPGRGNYFIATGAWCGSAIASRSRRWSWRTIQAS